MKSECSLLCAVLTIALTLPMFGQVNMKQPDLSGMMGKPTADTSVGGVQMKMWLMTQEKMGQMTMQGEKESGMERMEMTGMNDTSLAKGMHQDSIGVKDTYTRTNNDTVEAIQGSRSMTKSTMDSITAGTHRIVLDVTEIASGKEIPGASAGLLIESPSKKSSSVDLKSTMEHFEGALTLNEKGEYRFTVNVSFGGATKTTQFQYAVK
jgi:hypothetical protein